MTTLTPEARELVLTELQRCARNWAADECMQSCLKGARRLASNLLFDGTTNMDEADRLCDEAIDRGRNEAKPEPASRPDVNC